MGSGTFVALNRAFGWLSRGSVAMSKVLVLPNHRQKLSRSCALALKLRCPAQLRPQAPGSVSPLYSATVKPHPFQTLAYLRTTAYRLPYPSSRAPTHRARRVTDT